MAPSNKEIAGLLQEYADLQLITGGDPFRARAYERAARAVEGYPAEVAQLDLKGLRAIPNVGASTADKVHEYLRTGRMPALEEAREQIPAGVRELVAIPTLGPKKAMTVHRELGVSSVPELLAAIDREELRGLKGFGPKTEENIRHGVEMMRASGDRVRADVAMEAAEDLVGLLSAVPGCENCVYAGSLRRMRDTIGDVDILVAARRSGPFMTAFTQSRYAHEVIASGPAKTSVRTAEGLQIDLRVVPPASWGAALIYFTGSRAHNIRLRERAVHRKLKLSEYGLFHARSERRIVSRTEEEVYRRLGLPWIPPTLREDRGEIAAAERGELPQPVTAGDVRGDLHTHTDLTDGIAPLEDMVRAAARRGLRYYAVTDHAPDLAMQRMTKEKMLAQREQVRALDRAQSRMRLLHGTELNIAEDGSVDWPAEFLAGFDLCVASVHSYFGLSRQAQTRRLVRACENPHVDVIGHPMTRIIGRRPGIDVDLDAFFQAAARTGTVLEINAHPHRLDLYDEDILRARHHGVRFAVNTDAHSVPDLDNLRYGVGTAQRGRLTPDDVVNTWPLNRLRKFLRDKRER
ncbi:MAG TPA: DNA polymerase/3'-5' exonuclease PolX [Streptomyces sp.]|nr:DNA polymerase/3'-5' exonuclease PolX [Streptomyces sp.]